MIRIWQLLILCGLLMSRAAVAQSSPPPLNANDWNFVLVQAFESEPDKGNNLSVVGLNHSLRFGQLLSSLTAGRLNQVKQVYALTLSGDGANMGPLESIQPYAILNNLPVKVQKLSPGDASTYNSPAYFVQQILANQARGTYVMAMPLSMMSQIVQSLAGSSIAIQTTNQYLVVSGTNQPLSVSLYDDQIAKVSNYPRIPLPARSACSQAPVTLQAKVPPGLRPYASQSVYLIRHVEAHPSGNFENGNYVCQGQWRALGANDILLEKMGKRKPDYIYTSNPLNIIDCGAACSYIRPSLTVAPFAIQHGIPLTLAAFQWQDAPDLAHALFDQDSYYFKHPASGSSILVGWEHDHIEKAVKYLLASVYQNPEVAAKVPAWNFDDYDTIWELFTDKDGNLTFKNSCEGIPTSALPSTCPAFFQ